MLEGDELLLLYCCLRFKNVVGMNEYKILKFCFYGLRVKVVYLEVKNSDENLKSEMCV